MRCKRILDLQQLCSPGRSKSASQPAALAGKGQDAGHSLAMHSWESASRAPGDPQGASTLACTGKMSRLHKALTTPTN